MNGLIRYLHRKKKKTLFYLFVSILLYFVFQDEVASTFLINTSSKILSKNNRIHEPVLVYCLLSLQIIFSPLQSGFSDYYLRRKSLIVSISATLISVILLKLSTNSGIMFLAAAIIIKGVLGNTLPIAWAGIADEARGKNIRFFLALSICALAVGSWGSLLVIPHLATNLFFWIVTTLAIIALLYAIYPYVDKEDIPNKDHPDQDLPKFKSSEKISLLYLGKNECIGLYRLGIKPLNFLSLISFLFSEVSFYQILFRLEVFSNYQCFTRVPLAIGIGYTVGTIALKFIKANDKFVSCLGLSISIISILLTNILFAFDIENQIIFTAVFSFFSFGYALFTPSLFSIITPREHPHLQGKTYGLLESTEGVLHNSDSAK